VITRSVRDSAAMLDHTAGPDVGAPYYPPPPARPFLEEVGTPPGKLRIAWTTQPFLGRSVHPDCEEAVRETVGALQRLGHEVREAAPEVDGTAFSRAFVVMLCAELRGDMDDAEGLLARKARRGDFESATWALGLLGRALSAAELSRALRRLQREARRVGQLFTEFDVLLTPTLAVPPFPVGALQPKPADRFVLELAGRLRSGGLLKAMGLVNELASQVFQAAPYTAVFNVTGQPAMSVPLHWNREGLPVGLHFVGRYADEATLFRLAAQLERERPWADRWPPSAGTSS
jgi:amidase